MPRRGGGSRRRCWHYPVVVLREPPLPLRAAAALLLWPVVVLLSLLPGPAQSFLSHSLRLAWISRPSGGHTNRVLPPRTQRFSDPFFNFEALRRKLNLTHFSDPALDRAPPLPEEDFGSRPDLIKAQEIGRSLRPELESEAHLASVSVYFHVAHHHLQSYREALEAFVADQRARYGGCNDVHWEAFQQVGLPAALDGSRYPGSQAGRVPSRARLLLCGAFRDAEAEARAKDDVAAWRQALCDRLRGYQASTRPEADVVETMPPSQAIYRRLVPEGSAVGDPAPPSPSSLFVMGFLQSSWSSERKVRAHVARLREYVEEVTRQGLVVRADLLQSPDYPSAQKVWHHFADEDALVGCLSSAYADLLQDGARFRARVNHVEQAFAPLVPARATVLARQLASTGAWLPLVGYGTSVFSGREREGDLPLGEAVRIALRAGVRLLDCSPDYGTQREVGAAVAEALRAGEMSHRSKLFVVSSVSAEMVGAAMSNVQAEEQEKEELLRAAVRADVARTLEELGLESLDALLLPYPPAACPDAGKAAIVPLWRALESLVGPHGPVRHLGVADFPLEALVALDQEPAVTRRPELCSAELHPFYRDEALLAYCQDRGGTASAAGGPIQVLAHTPLGRPAKSRPPGTCILREPLVELSGEALEATPAQVVLRWSVQQGAAVLPNSLSRDHILANACLHAFTMAPFRVDVLNEMSALRALRFADPARPPAPPPALLERVAAEGLVFQDDGKVVPPGSDYEYLELTVEVFDRLDLGDVAELLVEPKQVAGAFPGMDVEPVEE